MANKVIIKISFSTFLISGILLNLYFYLKYGADYLHTEDLIIGIPLWTLLSTYAVYGGANYYYKQKHERMVGISTISVITVFTNIDTHVQYGFSGLLISLFGSFKRNTFRPRQNYYFFASGDRMRNL